MPGEQTFHIFSIEDNFLIAEAITKVTLLSQVKSSQVKFISLYVRFKNTQAGNSEKTMRSSKSTAPCSHILKTI